MRLGNDPSTKLFHGVCPSCGTIGLRINDTEEAGALSCPTCEWDSSITAGDSIPGSEQDARRLRPVS